MKREYHYVITAQAGPSATGPLAMSSTNGVIDWDYTHSDRHEAFQYIAGLLADRLGVASVEDLAVLFWSFEPADLAS